MAIITIDNKTCEAEEGLTLMEVARREGLPVASLCYSDHLRPYGSCRLCMVQVEGQRALSAACTTPVRDGMVVYTNSPNISRIRRTLLELYMSEDGAWYHPDYTDDNELHNVYPSEETGRSCSDLGMGNELYDLAGEYDADPARFRGERHLSHKAVTEMRASITPGNVEGSETGPYFSFDPSLCILCARCIRACDEIQGQGVLHLEGRGFFSEVAPAHSFAAWGCVTCGACVKECPTGALSDRLAVDGREYRPVDRVVRTTCAYCGVGCQFDARVSDDQIVAMRPVDDSPVNKGHACVKGRYAFDYVRHPDRLTRPLIRDASYPGGFRESSWDEAISLIASSFRELLDDHGPDAVACISSSRGTNEENYVMQKFARVCLGNNHVDNCARVCHSSTVAGMQEVFGTGAATNSLADIDLARLIMVVGANPTEAHPVTGARIKRAARRGTQLIVIDPRKIELTRYADVHLQLRPGTNVAVLNGLAHVIIAEGLADNRFIEERTENYEAYRDTVTSYTPERVEEISGVPAHLLRRAARLYATSGASMACHGLGVTEHRTGSYGVMALANLAILTGNIGRPGTGINPLRGQNNVQGSCDVGALPNVLTAYQKYTDPDVRTRFEAEWGVALPQEPGRKIPEMWEAALAGKLKAMWIVGYDAAHTEPNTKLVRKALTDLDFLVVSDLFLSETARLAHVVLPAAGALEKDGTFTNGERRVQRVRRVIDPPGEARSDWEAICAVAAAMGKPMPYQCPSEIMDEIAHLTPPMAGINYKRLEEGGLQWPVADTAHPGTAILHTASFPRGRARFAAVEYLPPGEETDDRYPLVLVTGRVLQHYNAGTMTRRTRLATMVDRDLLEVHPDDGQLYGLRDRGHVAVRSRHGSAILTVRVSERVAPGTAFTSFHFPEDQVNTLLSSSSDIITRCPEYKVLAVRVEPRDF